MVAPLIPIVAGVAAFAVGYELFFAPKKGEPIKKEDDIPKFRSGVIDKPKATGGLDSPAPGNPQNPASLAANAVAHLTQPQPPDQPPLPPAPSPSSAVPGTTALVNTKDVGQAGALRVRVSASTKAASVAGGEPGSGGGYPHLSTVTVTGPMTAGFWPTTGLNAKGQTISGFAWAGYLKPVSAAIAGEVDFGADAFDADSARLSKRGRTIRG